MLPVKSILTVVAVTITILVFVVPWNQSCSGNADCMSGDVTEIIDGNTIKVNDKYVRLVLVFTPELDQSGGLEAKEFLGKLCPVGSPVLVDEDDGQINGNYGEMFGMVHCRGKILNEEIITSDHGILSNQFCLISEFSEMGWASDNGC